MFIQRLRWPEPTMWRAAARTTLPLARARAQGPLALAGPWKRDFSAYFKWGLSKWKNRLSLLLEKTRRPPVPEVSRLPPKWNGRCGIQDESKGRVQSSYVHVVSDDETVTLSLTFLHFMGHHFLSLLIVSGDESITSFLSVGS